MNLPFILDVVIGLICIYLALSLLSSGVQELFATLLQWRAAHLKKAIEILISGENTSDETISKSKELLQEIYDNPLIKAISQESRGGMETWLRKITRSIVTVGRQNNSTLKGNEPSYIPSETFAATLIERLKLSQISQKLTVLKLRSLTERDILFAIEVLLQEYFNARNNQSGFDLKNQHLSGDFENLKSSFNDILSALQSGKISLQTSVYRIRSELNNYIRKTSSKVQLLEENTSAESGTSLQSNSDADILIQQLMLLQRGIFYDDETFDYSNINEIIHWLQPTLSEVLEVFRQDITSSPQGYEQYGQSYQDIKTYARKIVQDLPLPLQQSLAALARMAEINLPRARYDLEQLQDEFKQFKVEIQNWFDRSMDRASGVYKRNAKGVGFLIGLILAITINADTIHISNRLANDTTLRNLLVSNADQIIKNCPPTSEGSTSVNNSNNPSLINCITQTVKQETSLPLGWSSENIKQQDYENKNSIIPLSSPFRKILGWAVTGFAISMGASFWFDLLNKVINVRNTGKKPETQVDVVKPSKNSG